MKRTNTKRSKNNFTRSLLLLRVVRASLRSILQTHPLFQTVTYNGAETSETSETVETSESFWQISGGFLNAASGQCFGSFGFLPCPVEQRLCFRMLFDPNNYSVFITCFISWTLFCLTRAIIYRFLNLLFRFNYNSTKIVCWANLQRRYNEELDETQRALASFATK